jgi:5-methylcytosine-specific restriction endonuclease McrA
MLLKACSRCGNLIPYGATYCSTCLPIVKAEREARIQESRLKSNREYNKTRDPKYTRFYSSTDWRVLSAKRLQDDGYRCVWCRGIATEVDHIQEIQTLEGWLRRLDYDNLRSMCHTCHDKRHGRFIKKGKRSRRP